MHFGYFDGPGTGLRAALENMNRKMADAVGIAPGDVVLDAGCGVGASALWVAANCGASIEGVTISPLQAEKAQAFAAKEGLDVEITEQDFTSTSFADESIDVVWALESFCHSDRKHDFVQEGRCPEVC